MLVERLKKGDIKAFDLIYEKYSGKLYAFGYKYLRSEFEAEELVQSVFLKIWENRNILKEESSFKSYMFTIAYHDICKFFRIRNYFQKFITDTLAENSHSSVETEHEIDYRSVMERILQFIEMIPDRRRIIFLKSFQEGKSSKEIAIEENLSPGTVDNYISESVKFIRKRLFQEDSK